MEKHIPEGYKQTEVGVIPVDWVVLDLEQAVDFLDGQRKPIRASDRNRMKGSFPYYGASGVIDFVNDYIFDETLILLGEDGENILSRSCRLAFLITGKTWINNHAHVLRAKQNFDSYYLCELLEALNYENYNTGTAQPKLNQQVCRKIKLAVANNLSEQIAIATALSDVDNLITSLEQLIEKKKAIKQGTMQELLTGKRRLKGFGEGKGYKQTELGMIPEDWEVKRLHELGEFQSGIGFPLYLQGKHQEVIPFYKVSDMNNNGNEVLMLNSNNYISKKDLVKLRTTIVPRSSIVFAKIGAALFLERKRILLVDSLIDNNMMAIIADIDNIDVKYLYYLLMNTKFSKYANTTALPSINRNDIGEIKFKIPSLHEQEAITQVLTNMDSEIEKLESKVDKYKQIKQGMMQNLLTGRIRLV